MIDLDFRLQDDLGPSGANSPYRWKDVSRMISLMTPVYFRWCVAEDSCWRARLNSAGFDLKIPCPFSRTMGT